MPFDSTHGDSANIQAGDHVDVYAMFNLVAVNAAGIPIGTGAAHTVLRMIMPNVSVQNVNKGSGGNATFYFKVTDSQATKLAFASFYGMLWLSLRPAAGA